MPEITIPREPPRSERIHVTLTHAQLVKLNDLAAASRRSLSSVIGYLIERAKPDA